MDDAFRNASGCRDAFRLPSWHPLPQQATLLSMPRGGCLLKASGCRAAIRLLYWNPRREKAMQLNMPDGRCFLKGNRLPSCIPSPELASASRTSRAVERAPWRMSFQKHPAANLHTFPELASAFRRSHAVETAPIADVFENVNRLPRFI